jgi:hypothetical protein
LVVFLIVVFGVKLVVEVDHLLIVTLLVSF